MENMTDMKPGGITLADFAQGRFTDDAAQVEPADAGLLRALATDVEQEDSGYVFGAVTAAKLRALADWMETERPVSGAGVSAMLRKIGEAIGDGAAAIDIQAVYAEPRPGDLTPADLPALLDALRQSDESAIGDD